MAFVPRRETKPSAQFPGLSAEKVVLETKAKNLDSRWSELAELGFRRGPIAERETQGEHVQIRLRTSANTRDILEGAVRSFDDKSVTLVHATLGELNAWPRSASTFMAGAPLLIRHRGIWEIDPPSASRCRNRKG